MRGLCSTCPNLPHHRQHQRHRQSLAQRMGFSRSRIECLASRRSSESAPRSEQSGRGCLLLIRLEQTPSYPVELVRCDAALPTADRRGMTARRVFAPTAD
jgi:hypothetical protein